MILQQVKLQNFRSYTKKDFGFDLITIIVGENGSGKSNLLEAIYLLATGKSFRADLESEMINYSQAVGSVEGQFQYGENIKIVLTDGSMVGTRKKFLVNGVSRRMIDTVGKLRAVLFSPQDLELVTGSPSARRRYLDFVISQVDREYRRSLISYEKGLRQRNKLLEMIREGLGQRNQLFFWDKLLIKNGDYLTMKRREYLASFSGVYEVVYDASIISETRLKQYETEEVAAAATLVGPHRDDFVINLHGRDVSKYGSRGEQRMAVLWLKTGELHYLNSDTKPALLLDDIFSELDHKHRQEVETIVTQHTQNGGQVVMTSADEHLLPEISGKVVKLG